MKNFKWLGWVGAAALSAALAACGSGGDSSSDTASLRVANATITHPSLDLLINGTASTTGTALDTVSTYVGPSSGSVTLQLNDNGSGTALTTTVPTLTGGQHYTLLAYESGGAVKTAILNEDFAAPTTAVSQLRVFDAASDAGKVDVYISLPTADLSTLSPTASFTSGVYPSSSALTTFSAGTYRVRVTGYGNKNDLRLDIPSVVLATQQVGTIVLTPASGGVLLNGAVVIQQGAYTASRNTNARVRLAAAVSGGATVAASAGSTVIDAGSVAPAFNFYVLVPAANPLNITVNSASVAAPAATLKAGSDATLLVYGPAAGATASLITDDNRPPTDTTTVKLRLINGITGNAGALTLTANTALVANAIAPGTASSYVSVLGSTTAMNLSLTSSLAGPLPPNTSNTLNPNNVYSIMATDPVSSPLLLIR